MADISLGRVGSIRVSKHGVSRIPPGMARVDLTDAMRYHNHFRHKHGAPPLEWDKELSQRAQAWADYLVQNGKLEHAPHDMRKGEGESIYTGYGKRGCGKWAVKIWYRERHNYDFEDPSPKFNPKSGHFSQLVWMASTHVGMGGAVREEDGCAIIVARYKVGGNLPGKFEENVKPLVEDDENSDDEYEEEYDDDDYEEILDHFSEEEDETEFDIKFRKKTVEVVPTDVIYDYHTETVGTATEPIRGIEAHFRSHKHVYPQDGKTYILTHGFYE